MRMALNFDEFEFLSFDCYGTLINWEKGILGVLQPILQSHAVVLSDDAALAVYGEIEPKLQRPYRRYRDVLRDVVREFGKRTGFVATEEEMDSLPQSLKDWHPYEDTVAALGRLKKKYKLVILSNIDDHLFAASAKHLQVKFDAVITAEQVKSYKPDHAHWIEMLHRCKTVPQRVLHVGQSIYHDVVPGKAMGFKTIWVHRAPGYGATRPAHEEPDLEVKSLKELADLAGA
ncbi:HAD-superfamily hydrolase, subfamily IA, variant 2 [Candidatus Koribacter versatilis Ellin345]|uniref:HAD-superfamily hydrolase, subfamily IA, variant 2 n=1 Tax=Koribacter versatilis (strain Ellin345) TaxID=204669 RepID=Q1IIK8_KORVE|nr:HAD-IA family hydrolase [Candidatus Koribacter versatilis]ABF43292.1 HAD-superfamily hydrolase, subfamily IA, variant 2 [Candidatus Koribacter versatilis Ellin345]